MRARVCMFTKPHCKIETPVDCELFPNKIYSPRGKEKGNEWEREMWVSEIQIIIAEVNRRWVLVDWKKLKRKNLKESGRVIEKRKRDSWLRDATMQKTQWNACHNDVKIAVNYGPFLGVNSTKESHTRREAVKTEPELYVRTITE